MEIQKTRTDDRLQLVLDGQLDSLTAPLLDAEMKALDADVKRLSFDFKNLEYISSAGLRTVLAAQKEMNSRHGEMTVSGANESVMRVFDLTGFSSVLTFV